MTTIFIYLLHGISGGASGGSGPDQLQRLQPEVLHLPYLIVQYSKYKNIDIHAYRNVSIYLLIGVVIVYFDCVICI